MESNTLIIISMSLPIIYNLIASVIQNKVKNLFSLHILKKGFFATLCMTDSIQVSIQIDLLV